MRNYEILSGINKGTHIIYDNVKELQETLQDFSLVVPNWKEGIDKQWVQTDDGRVVQILNIYSLSNYNGKFRPRYIHSKKTGNWIGSKSVKVCFGVYTMYGKKNGDIVANKMLAEPFRMEDFRQNRTSITAQNTILGKYLTDKKKMFVYYVWMTGNPIYALKKVLNNNIPYIAKKHTVYKALELMKDEFVIKELNTYMNTEEKKQTFKEMLHNSLEAEGLGVADFVKELKDGLRETKKGGLAHKQWVEMYGKIVTFSNSEEPDMLPEKMQQPLSYKTEAAVLLPPPPVMNKD